MNLCNIVLPVFEVNGVIGGTTIAITLPLLEVEGYTGHEVALNLPFLEVSSIATTETKSVNAVLPSFEVSANVLVGEIVKVGIKLPVFEVSTMTYAAVLCHVAVTLPAFQVEGNILVGQIGSVEMVLPVFTLSSQVNANSFATGAIILPLFVVDAHGDVIAVTVNRKVIAMNLFPPYAVSEWKNYSFNSIFRLNGYLLGSNEQGIFILDGDTDMGQQIEARIKSGLIDLGESGQIAIPREAWLAYRSEGGLQLDMRIDEKVDLSPTFFDKVASGIMEMREKIDRGIKARFLSWDLKNLSGTYFSIQSLRILGDIIGRKTR